jgi:hypothetical protein
MRVIIENDLTINNIKYKPIEVKKRNKLGTKIIYTDYRYYIEGWNLFITQENNNNIVSIIMTESDETIDSFLKNNHIISPKYKICFAVELTEIEECFLRIKNEIR